MNKQQRSLNYSLCALVVIISTNAFNAWAFAAFIVIASIEAGLSPTMLSRIMKMIKPK